jgi:hypothetical protein
MDNEREIIRRLALLDRKLNYLAGLAIGLSALSIGALTFFVSREVFQWRDAVSAILAFGVGAALGRRAERGFRPADP